MSNTLCIMRLMDDARAQLGVTYDSVRRSLHPLPHSNRPHAFGPPAAQLLWCACAVQDAASITVGQAAKM